MTPAASAPVLVGFRFCRVVLFGLLRKIGDTGRLLTKAPLYASKPAGGAVIERWPVLGVVFGVLGNEGVACCVPGGAALPIAVGFFVGEGGLPA